MIFAISQLFSAWFNGLKIPEPEKPEVLENPNEVQKPLITEPEVKIMPENLNKMTKIQLTKNFALSEFSCNDKNNTPVPKELMPNVIKLANELQKLRDIIGCEIHINSGYRTPEYNKKLSGSATNSQHLLALAADCTAANYSPNQFADMVEKLISEGKVNFKGLGRYNGFTHLDCREKKARWDNRK